MSSVATQKSLMEQLTQPGVVALGDLPWDAASLGPKGVSEETVNFHYGKHHAGYVNKLAAKVKGTELEKKSVVEIVKTAEGGLFNLAAQHWNHSFYWNCLSPNGGGDPSGALKEALSASFGSVDGFKEQFSTVAAGHFGSGWAWLCKDSSGKLSIVETHDAGNPMTSGLEPVMTCDVWEHAYYIDFRNARADYIQSYWNLVNWDYVSANL